MKMRDCGILIVHDRNGYICGRVGSEICSDCGTGLCAHHTEVCKSCLKVYCDCCRHFHLKELHTRKPVLAWTMPNRRSA